MGDFTGFPRIYFNNGGDAQKLVTIDQWGTGQWTTMANAFEGCSNMTSSATDAPDLTGVTSLHAMFRNASAFNGDISIWITSSITEMGSMFDSAISFNQDIGGWDTSNVANMSWMFFNTPISLTRISAVGIPAVLPI